MSGKDGSGPQSRLQSRLTHATPRGLAAALGLWGAWYAAYRLYYAFGGQLGMIGVPRSPDQFRQVNLAGGALILLTSATALFTAITWRRRSVRRLVVVAGWIAAVACCTHALTDLTLRLLSLSGVHPTQLSPEFWLSFDRRTADLQDIFLNEPWFLIEGCLAGRLAHSALPPRRKRQWMLSAVIVTAVATAVGVASGVGLIPTIRIG